jgi:hypothetical protein
MGSRAQGAGISLRGGPFGELTVCLSAGGLVEALEMGKGKAISLQSLTGPEGSSRLRLPDFKTIGT